MAAKMAACETNETQFLDVIYLNDACSTHLNWWGILENKLIFMKIQDGRQDGRHNEPHGTRFDIGGPQNSWIRHYNDYKNVG